MRFAGTIIISMLMLGLASQCAEAVCSLGQTTPYTPSTIPVPSTTCCCCWNNFYVYQSQSQTLVDDFFCCDHFSLFCDTWREHWVLNTIQPTAFPGEYNPIDPYTGQPQVCDVVWDTLDLDVCRCNTDGYAAHPCNNSAVGTGNHYLIFCCTGCPSGSRSMSLNDVLEKRRTHHGEI
jgi:hypothetical protein